MTIIASIIAASLAAPQSAPAAPAQPAAPAPPPPAPIPAAAALPASAAPVADVRGTAGIPMLVAPDARPDLIINGLVFAEGPTADSAGQTYYTDLSSSTVYRVVLGKRGYEAERILDDSNGCLGLEFARSGRLYSAQYNTGRIVELQLTEGGKALPRGVVESYGGEARPCVNDLVATADGGIWFTNTGDPRRATRRGIYFTTEAGAEPVQFTPAIQRPNGIALSPDEKTLYVADAGAPLVWSFPVEGPGKLGEGRPFANVSVVGDPARVKGADGIAVDALGNLWVAVPMASAVVVIDPQGQPLGRVMLPEYPSNCAFGGADGRLLFITARTGVYLLPTIVEGHWTAKGGAPARRVADPAAPAAPAPPVSPPAQK
jgi:gluconolactonase